MKNIHVHRYPDVTAYGYAGWLEPHDKSWIAFVNTAGVPRFFLHRDPQTGVVLPDDAEARTAATEQLRYEERRAASWAAGQAHTEEAPAIVYAQVIVDSGRYVGRAAEDGPIPPN